MKNFLMALTLCTALTACGSGRPSGTIASSSSPAFTPSLSSSAPSAPPATGGGSKGGGTTERGLPRNTLAHGIVRDGADAAVGGICVDLWGRDVEEDHRVLFFGVATTNEDGRYVVGKQGRNARGKRYHVEGTFKLRFRDCRSRPQLAFQWNGGARDVSDAEALVARARVDARLRDGGSIAGRAVDQHGRGADLVCVALYDGTVHEDDELRYVPYAVVSAEQGRYRFGGLAAKTYRVRFHSVFRTGSGERNCKKVTPQSYEPEWYGGQPAEREPREEEYPNWPDSTPVRLQEGENKSGINASLVRTASLTGVLRPGKNVDCPSAIVRVYDASVQREVAFDVISECDGRWLVEGLDGGSYKVKFSGTGSLETKWYQDADSYEAATVVEVAPEQMRSGLDATIDLE